MAAVLAAVHVFSLFILSVHNIHVPGENVDKKVLTSLGIKTIGWQGESTINASSVSVYHNYSKISLQNENVQSYNQYSQPQTTYSKTTKNSAVTQKNGNVKNTHFDLVSNQPNIDQAKDFHTSKNVGLLNPSNDKPVFQPTPKNVHGSYILSGEQTNGHYLHKNNGQQMGGYARNLEFEKIVRAEKQNQETQSFLNFDLIPDANNFFPSSSHIKASSSHNSNSYKYQNSANSMVPYLNCPEMATGQFIYQSSCYQFLNCWKGRGFVQNCAPGTLFNPRTLECDFASKVQCLTDSPSYYSERYRDFNAEAIHSKGIQCPYEFAGVIPHKTDCSKFINCAYGVEHVMDCPPGTLFSLKINNCDYPYKTECAGWSVEFGTNEVNFEGSETTAGSQKVNGVHQTTEYQNGISQQTGSSHSVAGSVTGWGNTNYGHSDSSSGTLYTQGNSKYGYEGNQDRIQEQTGHGYVYLGTQIHEENGNKLTPKATEQTRNSYSHLGTEWNSQNGNSQWVQETQQTSFLSNQGSDYSKHNSGFEQNVQYPFSQKVVNENVQKVHYGVQEGYDHTPRCPYGTSGLFPHPTVCSKFLNCANGQMFIQDCGPGTVFNPSTKVCDFPYNVECSNYVNIIDVRSDNKPTYKNVPNQIGPTVVQQNQFEKQDKIEEAGSNINNQYVTPTTDKTVKKEETPSNQAVFKCPNEAFSIYPHPLICEKYIACMNGKSFIYTCASGTVFNPIIKICDSPSKVRCYKTDDQLQNKYQGLNSIEQKQEQISTKVYGHYENGKWVENSSNNIFENNGKRNENVEQTHLSENTGILCPSYPVGFYPHPSVCSMYFSCFSGKPTVYKCATGSLFNPFSRICEIAHKVKCGVSLQQSNANNQDSFLDTQNTSKDNNGRTEKPSTDATLNYGKVSGSEIFETRSKFKKVCSVEDFYCSSNLCIPKSMECDGTKDCPNGSDENNCNKYLNRFVLKENSVLAIREKERYSNLTITDCAKSCLESKGFECKSFSYRSDAECFLTDSNIGLCGALIEAVPYTYYELAALTVDCTNLHKCPNNKCINTTQICDGVNDCGDRSDERGCAPESFGYQVRLAGTNNKHEGRIEIKAFGKWGYICDDRFGMRDADVVCRELGFPLGAAEVKGNSHYAKEVDGDNVLYLMDDVVCLGNETTIKDCDFNGWGVSNCEPQEIVGVVCKTPVDKCPKDQFKCDTSQECVPLAFVCDNVFDCPDQSDEAAQHCEAPSEIRLVDGKTEREGRLEIRHHGIWGTVCDDDFNDDAAKVVCNSLGYPGKATVKKDAFFGEGEGPIWLDQVFCQGNETLLQECTHWNWGEHNCEHAEDVGVICSKSGVTSKPSNIETLNKVVTESSSNLVEVPPTVELLPTECGLRKSSSFYIDEVHFRVVQGSVAKKGFYPWQASLRIKNNAKPTHWCGAIVVSKKFVLTAAHCLLGFSKGSYVVVAGDYNTDEEEGTEQEVYIEEFYIHEQFRNGQKMNNDIALIKLKGNGFTFTKDIQPICLPEADLEYTSQLNCTISGFGSVQTGISGYSHDLRAGWVPIQPTSVCKMPHVYGSAITDGMFCAGSLDEGVDACEGDSGGPLACLHNGVFTLYGITSWGQHCGHANKPGVYVKVAYYKNWIESTIRKNII